jgi:hypothetical protein
MNVFSVKSIGLYSLAILSAIGFFHLVTRYGEANLKAPIAVAGNYLIAGQDLPGCLQHKALLLRIQQSGIYLNANLITIDGAVGKDIVKTIDRPAANTQDLRPTLSGRLSNRVISALPNQLELSGTLPPQICPFPSQIRVVGSIASIDAPIYNRTPQLKGQLWLTSQTTPQSLPIEFTGIIQPATRLAQSH